MTPGWARPLLVALSLGALLAGLRPARAQITEEPAPPFPDPRKFAHGFYAEGEVGAVTFVGKAGDKMSPGIALGARLGYELTRWLAMQLHALGSTHQGNFENMPEADQLLQIYQGTAELRLTYTFRQLSLFAAGGAGVARLSSNLLATAGLTGPDTRTSFEVGGGGGLDYHTLNRHFSLGLTGEFLELDSVKSSGTLATTVYLRYTF